MASSVVPMIHVPDVRATVEWYEQIGFTVRDSYGDGRDGLSFAVLEFGESRVMFNQGGQPSDARRREVDLYVYTEDIDKIYEGVKDQVEIIETPHDKFYGMREFIFRDLNRFWITFAEESIFARVMRAAHEGNVDLLRSVLERGSLRPEVLNAALVMAQKSDKVDVMGMLENAGAMLPPQIDAATLRSYAGTFTGEGIKLNVDSANGMLYASLGDEPRLTLMAIDQKTFTPLAFDNYGRVTFQIEGGYVFGCELSHPGGDTVRLKRVG